MRNVVVALAALVVFVGCGGASTDPAALDEYQDRMNATLDGGHLDDQAIGGLAATYTDDGAFCSSSDGTLRLLAENSDHPGAPLTAEQFRIGLDVFCPDRLSAWDAGRR